MKTTFYDMEDESNPLNGECVTGAGEVERLFERLRGSLEHRRPFSFELHGENGRMLTIGIAKETGCVQHSSDDGQPPYLMAVNEEALDDEVFVEFLAGGTPTPIPSRFCLPIQQVLAIAQEFVATGERSNAVTWDET